MTDKGVMEKLDEEEKKKLRFLGLRKTKKLMKYSTELYNKLCRPCQLQVINNPKFKDYCPTCEEEVKIIEEKITKLQ